MERMVGAFCLPCYWELYAELFGTEEQMQWETHLIMRYQQK